MMHRSYILTGRIRRMPELKLSKLIPLFGKENNEGEKKVSPVRLELLITIVNRKKGDF